MTSAVIPETIPASAGDPAAAYPSPTLPVTPTASPAGEELLNMSAFGQPPQQGIAPTDWYLGLDIGTTALSAVLCHRPTGAVYPLYWWVAATDPPSANPPWRIRESSSSENRVGSPQPPRLSWPPIPCFRLPNLAYLSAEQLTQLPQMPTAIGLLAQAAYPAPDYPDQPLSELLHTLEPHWSPGGEGFFLHDYLPLLDLAWPYYSPQSLRWEPQLQWSETQVLPLGWCQQTLQALIHSLLDPPGTEVLSMGRLRCAAVGLDSQTFRMALRHLTGVCVSGCIDHSDVYAYNVREAVLATGLVAQPEQIVLVEGPIAALLTELQGLQQTRRYADDGTTPLSQAGAWTWDGFTLVIEAGASHTDLLLSDLPDPLSTLTYQDFWLRGLDYGGHALDQDIFCQLLLPQLSVRPPEWQGLTIPVVGEPDRERRARLQQQLAHTPLGWVWLQFAQQIKGQLVQATRPQVVGSRAQGEIAPQTFTLGETVIHLSPQDLEIQIFLPYLRRLNRELNTLLSQAGVVPAQIRQVICTGGTGAIGAMTRWLRQKLPNATILQDTQPNLAQPSCSRVAYGLALVSLYPQVIATDRRIYSDSFLLLELLRTVPTEPMSLTQILVALARRGINVKVCRSRIQQLLAGHLPQGLGFDDRHRIWLSASSQQHPFYTTIATAPLFQAVGPETYVLNGEQAQAWHGYLTQVFAGKHQRLDEPLVVSGLPSP